MTYLLALAGYLTLFSIAIVVIAKHQDKNREKAKEKKKEVSKKEGAAYGHI
jgi:hypothetical protein